MKTLYPFLLAAVVATGLHCSSTPEANEVAPAPTFDQTTAALMNELTPRVIGEWNLHQVRLKAQPYETYPSLPFPRDTTIQQFATLKIVPTSKPSTNPPDARNPGFDATLTYKGQAYPLRFSLHASAAYVLRKEGDPAYFLLEFNYPDGTRVMTPNEEFLQTVGFVGANYSLSLDKQGRMTWQGLKRGVARIELQK